jgi:plasmid replication initiation protein
LWACKIRNQSQRTWEISIDELRAKLEIPAEEYPRFSSLNQRVLREPIDEINAHTDLQLTYHILRRGRSPYAVRFTIIEGERTTTGAGELVHAEITKRIKQRSRTSKRDKINQLSSLPEPKEMTQEERTLGIEQLRRVKQDIYASKSSAN